VGRTSRERVLLAFEKAELDALISALWDLGYTVIGPTVRDGAVVYDEVEGAQALPIGVVDDQEAGAYRLGQWDRETYFAYTVGPHTWKRYLFPPEERLWRARRDEGSAWQVVSEDQGPVRYAFLGVRGCELAAIGVQDRVFLHGPFSDSRYRARREAAFIVAVNCTRPGRTCFCASLGTGPRARGPYDVALTELDDLFLVDVATEAGARVMASLSSRPATRAEIEEAERRLEEAGRHVGRALEVSDLHDVLAGQPEHPRWEEIAERCLACANCTLVCPTCFCFTVEDVTDLAGREAARVRRWDSCFVLEFTYTAGRPIRRSIMSRYRQWLTHKLAWWVDQFGVLGCVGCGRCITWCPVGIDLTAEVSALRASPGAREANDG